MLREAAHRADDERRPEPEARGDRAAGQGEPSGIGPQTRKRITEFIRPCIRSGVIAWRRRHLLDVVDDRAEARR